MLNNFSTAPVRALAMVQPTPMLGSLVPMVPMPGTAAGALGSYLGILVFRRGRDRKIELDTASEKDSRYA